MMIMLTQHNAVVFGLNLQCMKFGVLLEHRSPYPVLKFMTIAHKLLRGRGVIVFLVFSGAE